MKGRWDMRLAHGAVPRTVTQAEGGERACSRQALFWQC